MKEGVGWSGGGVVLALPLSKGQKECFQSSPLGQDTTLSSCGEETFDISRKAAFLIWFHDDSCSKDSSSYLVTDEFSGGIFFFFISFTSPPPGWRSQTAALNPTLNTDRVFTTPALLALLLCNVARMELDNVEDDAGLWSEDSGSARG